MPVTPRPSSSGPFLTPALSCMSSDEMGLTRRVETAQSDSTSGDESSVLIGAVSAADSPWDKRGAPGGKRRKRIALMALLTFVLGGALLYSRRSGGAHLRYRNELRVVTWNVAAVNNNPFEYWVTHDDAAYNRLMDDVQRFISDPAERDVEVGSVFTHAMWLELREAMSAAGMGGLDGVEQVWKDDFSKRRIISGFLKDKGIGEKRLASMPDRVTNTINLADGTVANRPTVINCFAGAMGSTERWWREWKRFMFKERISLPSGSSTFAADMLTKIKRSKYPALTAEEEAISIPLQTLAQAIFDAVLVHVVNSLSPGGKWQALQRQMCDSLNRRKDERVVSILAKTYSDASVIFLQESASVFVRKVEAHDELGGRYAVGKSSTFDGKRDQNSVLLLRRSFFREDCACRATRTLRIGPPAAHCLVGVLTRPTLCASDARSPVVARSPRRPHRKGGLVLRQDGARRERRSARDGRRGHHGAQVSARVLPRRYQRPRDAACARSRACAREDDARPLAALWPRREHVHRRLAHEARRSGLRRRLPRGRLLVVLGRAARPHLRHDVQRADVLAAAAAKGGQVGREGEQGR